MLRNNRSPTKLLRATGDEFTVTAGCDKAVDTCISKFNNVIIFRGFPFILGYNSVVSYPNTGDKYDEGLKNGGQA